MHYKTKTDTELPQTMGITFSNRLTTTTSPPFKKENLLSNEYFIVYGKTIAKVNILYVEY